MADKVKELLAKAEEAEKHDCHALAQEFRLQALELKNK